MCLENCISAMAIDPIFNYNIIYFKMLIYNRQWSYIQLIANQRLIREGIK